MNFLKQEFCTFFFFCSTRWQW